MTAAVETRPFWDLSRHASGTALVADGREVGYDDLADRVTRLAARLGGTRRLVLLEAGNDLDTVVGYLACLVGHHPVLVTAPGPTAAAARAAYAPDVLLAGGDLVEERAGTRHDLHPDLAVLLSTSGSTGSPKLVRLSRDAVAANARAIAEALEIRPDDVAATALPLHYCYGLSVLTSHLQVGASVLLTSASVVDPGFWGEARRHGVSTVPGVPHTFDLLDRAGFADLDLPALRYLTCAGGRLPATTATRYAELGLRRGFDLFLMYGATEATARMAVLPPDRVLTSPTLLGDPVLGGSFEVRPVEGSVADPDGRTEPVGELVFRGENVMLGYAESPADLARGREVVELRTGDLVRRTRDGLEVVGRLGRIAKVFGLRIDLDRVEARLRTAGIVGYVADAGDRVVVGVDRSARPLSDGDLARVLDGVEEAGVPRAGCVVVELDGVPRHGNGKVDHAAIAAIGRRARPDAAGCADAGTGPVAHAATPQRESRVRPRRRGSRQSGRCPARRPRSRRNGSDRRAGPGERRARTAPPGRHLRVPGWRLPVLRRDVAAPGAGPEPPARALAPPDSRGACGLPARVGRPAGSSPRNRPLRGPEGSSCLPVGPPGPGALARSRRTCCCARSRSC